MSWGGFTAVARAISTVMVAEVLLAFLYMVIQIATLY